MAHARNILFFALATTCTHGFLSTTRRSHIRSIDLMARTFTQAHTLEEALESVDLGHCFGTLQASGLNAHSDLSFVTRNQLTVMGISEIDSNMILAIGSSVVVSESDTCHIQTSTSGDFPRVAPYPWGDNIQQLSSGPSLISQFRIELLSPRIFKGVLLSSAQCTQINRMTEYYALQQSANKGLGGWSGGVYTLTSQHLLANDVPVLMTLLGPVVKQLIRTLYEIFPKAKAIRYENSNEPHLVKYSSKHKGVVLHTDSPTDITINIALSAADDYTGGGTFVKVLGETVQLKQVTALEPATSSPYPLKNCA